MKNKEPILIDEEPIPLESLELSRRAYNALKRKGYQHLDQIRKLGYDGLLALHGLGAKTAEEIWETLTSYLDLHAAPYSVSAVPPKVEDTTELQEGTPIERLDLSPSVCRKLRRRGYEYVELVAQAGHQAVKNLPNVNERQAREIWLATFAYWKTSDEKIPIKPALALPNLEPASIEVETLPLPIRARNALLRANVLTIGDLYILGRASLEAIHGLTEAANQEIWKTLESILSDPVLVSKHIELNTLIIPEMTDNHHTSTGIPNLPSLLPALFREISVRGAKDARDYEILKRRFGLEGSRIYKLDEIKLFYDEISTRERVRQIESRAISRLQRCLMRGNFRRLSFKVHESVVSEVKTLYKTLASTTKEIETEARLFELVADRYGLEGIDMKKQAAIRLLFEVYDFSTLSTSYSELSNISIHPAWVVRRGQVNIKKTRDAIRLIFKTLGNHVVPMSYFELKVRINKRRRKNPINDPAIRAALRLCADVESSSEDHYQIRFECLRGCGALAYRVLWDAGNPMSFNEVFKEINRRLAIAGESPVDRRTLQNAMVSEEHLLSDRKKWGVKGRDELVQATVVDIILKYFHKTGQPAAPSQIFEYISRYKKVRKENIYQYLSTRQDKFVRVGPGVYQPVAWGYTKRYEPERSKTTTRWSQDKVAELIEEIFQERKAKSMPFSKLLAAASEKMGKPPESCRVSIRKSPAIRVRPISESSNRLLAQFVPDFRDLPIMQKHKTRREQVWEAVEKLLRQSPSLSLPQQELLRKVRASVGVSRSTFYYYVSKMPNIIRSPAVGKGTVCTLAVEKTLDAFPELEEINDTKLVHELRLAVGLLDGEAIEMGLFHLGKLFEQEVMRFLNAAAATKVFPVSKRDRGRLADMVDCLERNGVITNKRTLDYLRQERNVHAHKVLDNREALRRDAPAIAKLYIQNIAYLWKERCKLEK